MRFWQHTATWRDFSWRDSSWRDFFWRGFSWQNFAWQDFAWPDFAALTGQVAGSEQSLRRKFWRKLKREAAGLPFAEQLLTAHYCAFDRQTPLYVKGVLVGAIVYFVVPDRFIPKYVTLIGLADDAAVLTAAFKAVSAHIKPEHREAARRALVRLRAG